MRFLSHTLRCVKTASHMAAIAQVAQMQQQHLPDATQTIAAHEYSQDEITSLVKFISPLYTLSTRMFVFSLALCVCFSHIRLLLPEFYLPPVSVT